MPQLPIQRFPATTRPFDFNALPIARRIQAVAAACCANPSPQLMYDTTAKKMVLQCMNCGAFVG